MPVYICEFIRSQGSTFASLWPKRSWFSEVLQLIVSAPSQLPYFPNLLTQAMGKFQHQNLPTLVLHAWELSSNQLEIKMFSKHCRICLKIKKSIYSENLWCKMGHCSNRCHRKKVNLVVASLTDIVDFPCISFSETKKCQISTIKGYRSMISNTFKI